MSSNAFGWFLCCLPSRCLLPNAFELGGACTIRGFNPEIGGDFAHLILFHFHQLHLGVCCLHGSLGQFPLAIRNASRYRSRLTDTWVPEIDPSKLITIGN